MILLRHRFLLFSLYLAFLVFVFLISFSFLSFNKEVKVKCTLVQALRHCEGPTSHRRSRGIPLHFLDYGTRRGRGSASRPVTLCPRERPVTHCTVGWVGPRAGLDRCGKSRSQRDSIPRPSSS